MYYCLRLRRGQVKDQDQQVMPKRKRELIDMKSALPGMFSFSKSKLIFQEEPQVVSDGREGCSVFGTEAACEAPVKKLLLRARVEESGLVNGAKVESKGGGQVKAKKSYGSVKRDGVEGKKGKERVKRSPDHFSVTLNFQQTLGALHGQGVPEWGADLKPRHFTLLLQPLGGQVVSHISTDLPGVQCFVTLLTFTLHPILGGGNEQSTDVISAWEGDSVSITCPMNGSQNQVGIYLRAIRQRRNVIYFSKEQSQKCDHAFDNRSKCSKEGENLRITLHRLKQSDSEIYLCSEIVKINDYAKELYGKTTVVLVKAKSSRALEQSPLYANPERGQSVSITCVLNSSPEVQKFYLFRAHVQPGTVLSVSNLSVSQVSPAFGNRLEYSREGNRTVITLHNLQEEDSDNYICAEDVMDSPLSSASGTMVLVKGGEKVCEKSSWGFYALVVVIALLFCALVCCTLYHVDVKKYFRKKKPNVVYEDMSYSSRRSTLVRSNNSS
ncbi:uncharacterized protein LOC134052213 [Cinclus cinclus]|uniref:uncharacterized protein LOC134052213 n=1 Tax=Cinclus cinclus TaxID=127875 RepID=UPI002E0F0016